MYKSTSMDSSTYACQPFPKSNLFLHFSPTFTCNPWAHLHVNLHTHGLFKVHCPTPGLGTRNLWVDLPTAVRDGASTVSSVGEVISGHGSSTIQAYLLCNQPNRCSVRHTEKNAKVGTVDTTFWDLKTFLKLYYPWNMAKRTLTKLSILF